MQGPQRRLLHRREERGRRRGGGGGQERLQCHHPEANSGMLHAVT